MSTHASDITPGMADDELYRLVAEVLREIKEDDSPRKWFLYDDPATGKQEILFIDRPCNEPAMARALAAEFEAKAAEMLRWAESLRDAAAVLALVD